MVHNTSHFFSITFRPRIEEWLCIKEDFLNLFIKKYNNEKQFPLAKYVVAPEKGESETINHYQIHLQLLDKERRKDVVKKTIFNIMRKFDISDKNVALKINIIKNKDVDYSIGYCMKEQDNLDSCYIKGFTNEDIERAIKIYTDKHNELLLNRHKTSISNRNLHICVKRFIECNKEFYSQVYTIQNVKVILSKMLESDYYMFNLISNRLLSKNIQLITAYLNKDVISYVNHNYKNHLPCESDSD